MRIPRTLVVTNDFPPRVGGVQQYVHNLLRNLPGEQITVLAPSWPDAAEFDREQPFRVERAERALRPTRATAERIRELIRAHGAEVVLFAHGLPLGLLGPGVARRGVPYLVLTHGTEYWYAMVPGLAVALKRATSQAARVFAISRFTARTIRTVVPEKVPMSLAPPGVDVDRFRPGIDASVVRRRHGIEGRPLVVCVSRLVTRKGQDTLIQALRLVRRRVPEASLLIVGGGPDERRLRDMAAKVPAGSVAFAGQVSDQELPGYHAAADVFAMPCRSRRGGLEVEGFGIVYLEAAACGKAVVAGESGGAAEAVVHGETGLVVDGRATEEVADAVATLLEDSGRAVAMGRSARERAERVFAWPRLAERMAAFLRDAAG